MPTAGSWPGDYFGMGAELIAKKGSPRISSDFGAVQKKADRMAGEATLS